jgi:hypothetical protein
MTDVIITAKIGNAVQVEYLTAKAMLVRCTDNRFEAEPTLVESFLYSTPEDLKTVFKMEGLEVELKNL